MAASLIQRSARPTSPDASTCLGVLPLLQARSGHPLDLQTLQIFEIARNDRERDSVGHVHAFTLY